MSFEFSVIWFQRQFISASFNFITTSFQCHLIRVSFWFCSYIFIPGAEIQISAAASGVVPDDSFTVSQAVNALGFGKFQIILSFVTGLCWMADSMEVMILSILSPGNLSRGIDNCSGHSMAMGNLNESKETTQTATTDNTLEDHYPQKLKSPLLV